MSPTILDPALPDPAPLLYALAAALALPLGRPAARLAVALPVAWAVAASVGPAIPLRWPAALIAGGLAGFVAGLPIRVAGSVGLRAPAGGLYGRAAAWAVFFAIGGPISWLAGLGRGLDPQAAGAAWFESVLLLGLPVWLVECARWPIAGLLGRLTTMPALRLARAPAVALALIALLPLLAGWLVTRWS